MELSKISEHFLGRKRVHLGCRSHRERFDDLRVLDVRSAPQEVTKRHDERLVSTSRIAERVLQCGLLSVEVQKQSGMEVQLDIMVG
jgi:hypothetical protein